MGIGYESMQVFGCNIYDKQNRNGGLIDIVDLENKIEEVYGVILSEDKYHELLESGVNEEDINGEIYASKYDGDHAFNDYKVLMLIQYGNYVIGENDVLVGFKADLNKESFEKIEEKKKIFLEELEDFKSKTGLSLSQAKFELLTYIL